MILTSEILLDANEGMGKDAPQMIAALIDQVFKDNNHLAKLIICNVSGKDEPGFWLNKEEVGYLVKSIQHEYLNQETYYFARDLFTRMEKFLKDVK